MVTPKRVREVRMNTWERKGDTVGRNAIKWDARKIGS